MRHSKYFPDEKQRSGGTISAPDPSGSQVPSTTVGMDSDVTRICFFPWMVPVYHVASSRRPRTSKTVHRRRRLLLHERGTACVRPATVPRTANEIRPQTCKPLLGAAEIISLDTRSLQRAWTLKPLKHDRSTPCYEKETNSSSHPTTSASSEKCWTNCLVPMFWPSQISKPLFRDQENFGSLRMQAQTDSVW